MGAVPHGLRPVLRELALLASASVRVFPTFARGHASEYLGGMPRGRRSLALCALLASLAWTNVQAMTCCWTLDGVETQTGAAPGTGGHAGCHGPAAPEAPEEPAANAPVPCGLPGLLPGTATNSAHSATCCEASAPAETVAFLPDFEPASAPDFLARAPDARTGSLVDPGVAPPRDPPRFLSERLLI